jgi:hypothetical protein
MIEGVRLEKLLRVLAQATNSSNVGRSTADNERSSFAN